MDRSQLRPLYYAVKGGRDGNTVCTSWEDVRVVLAQADFRLTYTPLPITRSSRFRWEQQCRFQSGPDPSQFPVTGAGSP